MSANFSYTTDRTAYHLAIAVFLLITGSYGYLLITDLTHRADMGEGRLILDCAAFILPVGLLLILVPVVLEIAHRANLYHASGKGLIVALLCMAVLYTAWTDFSANRFKGWLTGLGYTHCAMLDTPSLLLHEVWTKKEECRE